MLPRLGCLRPQIGVPRPPSCCRSLQRVPSFQSDTVTGQVSLTLPRLRHSAYRGALAKEEVAGAIPVVRSDAFKDVGTASALQVEREDALAATNDDPTWRSAGSSPRLGASPHPVAIPVMLMC